MNFMQVLTLVTRILGRGRKKNEKMRFKKKATLGNQVARSFQDRGSRGEKE